jgi:hypothetical protein
MASALITEEYDGEKEPVLPLRGIRLEINSDAFLLTPISVQWACQLGYYLSTRPRVLLVITLHKSRMNMDDFARSGLVFASWRRSRRWLKGLFKLKYVEDWLRRSFVE